MRNTVTVVGHRVRMYKKEVDCVLRIKNFRPLSHHQSTPFKLTVKELHLLGRITQSEADMVIEPGGDHNRSLHTSRAPGRTTRPKIVEFSFKVWQWSISIDHLSNHIVITLVTTISYSRTAAGSSHKCSVVLLPEEVLEKEIWQRLVEEVEESSSK